MGAARAETIGDYRPVYEYHPPGLSNYCKTLKATAAACQVCLLDRPDGSIFWYAYLLTLHCNVHDWDHMGTDDFMANWLGFGLMDEIAVSYLQLENVDCYTPDQPVGNLKSRIVLKDDWGTSDLWAPLGKGLSGTYIVRPKRSFLCPVERVGWKEKVKPAPKAIFHSGLAYSLDMRHYRLKPIGTISQSART